MDPKEDFVEEMFGDKHDDDDEDDEDEYEEGEEEEEDEEDDAKEFGAQPPPPAAALVGAASTLPLPPVGKGAEHVRKTPSAYLDYYMESGEDVNTLAEEMIERYNELHADIQRNFPKVHDGAAPPHAHHTSEDLARAYAAGHEHGRRFHVAIVGAGEADQYLELFRLAEEFCLLLIPIGFHAFRSNSSMNVIMKNQLRNVYADGLAYKVSLMNSEGLQPILEYARREYGLMAM